MGNYVFHLLLLVPALAQIEVVPHRPGHQHRQHYCVQSIWKLVSDSVMTSDDPNGYLMMVAWQMTKLKEGVVRSYTISAHLLGNISSTRSAWC